MFIDKLAEVRSYRVTTITYLFNFMYNFNTRASKKLAINMYFKNGFEESTILLILHKQSIGSKIDKSSYFINSIISSFFVAGFGDNCKYFIIPVSLSNRSSAHRTFGFRFFSVPTNTAFFTKTMLIYVK